MVRREMERDLRLYGGVSNIGPIVRIDQDKPEAPKPLLYLTCRRYEPTTKAVCSATWEAPSFTPCPKCGQRQWVAKAERPAPIPTEEAERIDPLEAV